MLSIGGWKTVPPSKLLSGTDQIYKAFRTLEFMPEGCPLVPESGLSRSGIRQLFFGIGKQPTHRVIFFNDKDADTVTILRVRHHAQDEP
jgi:plasmid stabilization system protein ParE